MYDIIIVGAGVIGASIARTLAKYDLNILVLEKENDVGDGASGANSAILHSGYDPKPGSLKAKLNVLGNKMYTQICQELDVKMIRNGSLTLALDDEEVAILDDLVKRAKENGVEVEILSSQEALAIEPGLTKEVKKALLAKSAGIINPFELVVALMENAIDNGVKLNLNEEVINIKKDKTCFKVTTNITTYETKVVINASGVNSDKINEMINKKSFTILPRKGEYYVLDHFDNNYVKHVLFNVPTSRGKGVLVTPTTHYNYLIGPSSDYVVTRDDVGTNQATLSEVKNKSYRLVHELALMHQIRQFSGIRAVADTDDFIIEETSPNFINVAGIQSPGLASAPAIAKMVEDMINNKVLKKNYNPYRRPLIRLNELSIKERTSYINKNARFGHIICRCENISEGEVIDSLLRSCPPTTVKGVKKRVRPGFGKCQGGFCEPYVIKILAKHYQVDLKDIDYGKKGSYILLSHTKEGEQNE